MNGQTLDTIAIDFNDAHRTHSRDGVLITVYDGFGVHGVRCVVHEKKLLE